MLSCIESQAVSLTGGEAFTGRSTLLDPEVGGDRRFVDGGVQSSVVARGMAQWFRETLLVLVARLTVKDGGDDAVPFAGFLKVVDFLGDILTLNRSGRAKHDEESGAVQGTDDRTSQVRIRREGFFIAKHGIDSLWDHIAALVFSAD